nr:ent-kaur-16-ene synthase, chloroplastic-like [Lolium perenne]
MDEQIDAPVGFNVTFTGMITLANSMGLEFPVKQTYVDDILHIRQMELKRFAEDTSYGREEYMAYVAEGLGDMLDWNEVMKFQRKNGSLFNSPSATAAALIYNHDDKALQYLNLLVSKFGSSVPTVFPINIYCQLSMVDSLEKTGISHHFSTEIKSILDMTHSFWLQRDEEIMLDVATCAMAFRILRMNGYDVSSDELSHLAEASRFRSSLQGYLNDTKSLLELQKASTVSVSKNETILDNIGYWSSNFLKEKMSSNDVDIVPVFTEVEYAVKFPFYATMERLDHRRSIEHFDAQGYQMFKTSYLPCLANKDHLALAVEDFTFSQFAYQAELAHVESWVKENRIDQLQFARQKQAYCYLSASGTMFTPELSEARISFAKTSVLITIVDDFFDVAGSTEEIENLISLVEKWDEHQELQFYSESVEILFFAIYTTVNQLGESASALQNRDVRKHMIELWIETLRSMSAEAEWVTSQYVPTINEYMTNANLSYGLGPIIPASLYFVGQELSESVVRDQEYNELIRLMNICCRLLNDIQGYEREGSQGKVNSVSLLVLHSGGFMSSESAKKTIEEYIASCRKDLLRLVLKEDSAVPRPCKEVFWKMCKINHLFYSQTDGYSSQKEMVGAVNAVIYEPLKLQTSDPSLTVKSEH